MFLLPVLFIIFVLWLLFRPTRRSRRIRDSSPPPPPPDTPMQPLSEFVEPTTARSADPDPQDMVCRLTVPVQREVFSPPLPHGNYFKIIFWGRCAFKYHSEWHCFDACYMTEDEHCNYTTRHHGLQLDGKVVTASPIHEDRADHRYIYPYRANGGRLSVLLESPNLNFRYSATVVADIELTVVPMTHSEVLRLGLDSEEKKRQQEERKHREDLERQAFELGIAAHFDVNFLDPEFRQNFAKQNQTKIFNTLKAQWLAEYRPVHADAQLRALLEEQHPHVLPILEAKREVLRIAERLPFDEQTTRAQQAQAEARTARAERIAALVLACRDFAHYESEEWITEYATNPQHQKELLAYRDEILEADQAFHEDRDFIEALKASAPDTYRRATWRVKALAIADKLSAAPKIKPKKTLDEVLAGIERYRQRELNKIRVKVEDQKAYIMQNLELLHAFTADLDGYDLDEDEREALINEFKSRLLGGEEDTGNGFRQL
jgi:hypothetical protein